MKAIVKRISAALVVTVAAFAVNAPMTFAAGAAGGCDKNHSELTPLNDIAVLNVNGKYYLTDNLELNDEITISGDVTICLNGCEIKAAAGKRVFNVAADASLTICDCVGTGTITGGNVVDYGGGVYVDKGTFILSGGTISGNSATEGAGVYVNNGGRFTMTGGTISGNTASYQGGGVSVNENGSFIMSGGIIFENNVSAPPNNETDYGGGGVYTAGDFTMSSGSVISGNIANGCLGGGVCVSGRDAVFTLENNAALSGNSALHGGGVHVSDQGTVIMNGGTIGDKNTAVGGGGGISMGGGEFIMNGGSISSNTSRYGGGTYLSSTSAKFTLQRGAISGNTTTGEGGAGLYLGGGEFDMTGGSISNNTATGSGVGGGVYLSGGNLNMTGGLISNNTANRGSCVYMDNNNGGGTLLLNGKVTITSNTNSNVYLKNGKTITIGSGFSVTEKIGIHPELPLEDCRQTVSAATFATGAAPADISDKFKADVKTQSVVYRNNEIELVGPHSYDSAMWEKDSDKHWHICTNCGNKVEEATHRWDNGTITRQPTAAAAGERKYVCLDCAAVKTAPIPYTAPSSTGGSTYHDNDDKTPEKSENNNAASVPANPPTGIELAIAPAALAMAALTVAVIRKWR